MENTEKFEQALMSHLSDIKLEKATLKKYSSIIAQLRRQDLLIERIWKYGIPAPDGVIVRGRLNLKDLAKLGKVFEIPELRKIDIFPLGIPFPDFLDVRLKIGEEVENLGHGF